jgi:SIT4-associating protein SAP185/190
MAFWRFVNNGGSNFEALLSRDPPPTLEDLLDDDELLTECKTQNSKLIDFLGRPESVKSLLGWVVKGLETGETRGRETEEEKKRRSR